MQDLFRIGVITNTHGLRGEVKVFPTVDDKSRYKKLKSVILDPDGLNMALNVESTKFFKNLVIVKFKEFNDINDVEKYKKKELYVDRDNAVKLQKNEFFISDLYGLSVVSDDGKNLGQIDDVIQTGANDVYVIKGEKEILIPAISECIINVDMDNRLMTVHLMKGPVD